MRKIIGWIGRGLREVFWLGVAGAILFGGYLGWQYLGDNREVVEAQPVERPITLVDTRPLTALTGPLPIRGEGFVQPFRQVALSAQVGGRITELHPAITNRGTFTKGDVLARLDSSAEEASLAQTVANIEATQARLDLTATQLERSAALRARGVIAQEQLDQLESQKQELTASLRSLEAGRKAAEVALSNKVVLAPFDGAVLSKAAEVGAVVSGGMAIAELFTQDRMEIEVAVREADAALIPGLFDGAPAPSTVTIRFAGRTLRWDAKVSRVSPELDRQTRTLTVAVELNDVRAGKSIDGTELPSGAPNALINAFARVDIDGIQPKDTYAIASTALRGGDKLWVTRDGTLQILPARLIHVDGETSYVQIANAPKDARVIQTALSTPVEGMRLRDVGDENRSAETEQDQ